MFFNREPAKDLLWKELLQVEHSIAEIASLQYVSNKYYF